MDSEEKLRCDLCAWLEAERGRSSALARALGVSRARVSHWLTGRRKLDLHYGLLIQEFLANQGVPLQRISPEFSETAPKVRGKTKA
jgi:hypothetical protein